MPQPGLFGLEERYARLNERDPLVKYGNITFPHSGNDNSMRCYSGANQEKPEFVYTSRQRPSWIPAFAGMTPKKEQSRLPFR